MSKQKKRWYDYLWLASLLYLILGFFNILFAWLGLLCHGTHRTVDAPGSGAEQEHGDQAQHCGGKHNAVKTKGKLRDPRSDLNRIGPVPGQLEGPQQCNRLP